MSAFDEDRLKNAPFQDLTDVEQKEWLRRYRRNRYVFEHAHSVFAAFMSVPDDCSDASDAVRETGKLFDAIYAEENK